MSGVPEGYKMSEVGVIPEEWEVKTLGEIVRKFLNGGTPSTQFENYWNGNIPWITGADILNQEVSVIRRYITNDAVKNSSTNVIEKGNLLLVSRTGVGKLAIAPFDIAISQDFTGIYVKNEELFAEYLYRYFDFNQSTLQNQNQGTSIQGITRDTLSSIRIPLPPLPEQQAIASALSDVDALITALEQLISKKRNIKQGTMQQLLTGKKRLPGFSGEWEVKKLGEYVTIASGESPSKFKFKNNGTPYYKVDQLNYGNKYQKDTPYFIECNNPIPKGSIIFPKRGASILLNKVRILTEDAFMDTNLMTLTTIEELDNEYLYYMLIYIGLWHVADTTSIPQINNKHIKPLEIPFPTPPEQEAIAQILSDMDTEIEALEQKRNKYKAIKHGMMQELLTGKRRLA